MCVPSSFQNTLYILLSFIGLSLLSSSSPTVYAKIIAPSPDPKQNRDGHVSGQTGENVSFSFSSGQFLRRNTLARNLNDEGCPESYTSATRNVPKPDDGHFRRQKRKLRRRLGESEEPCDTLRIGDSDRYVAPIPLPPGSSNGDDGGVLDSTSTPHTAPPSPTTTSGEDRGTNEDSLKTGGLGGFALPFFPPYNSPSATSPPAETTTIEQEQVTEDSLKIHQTASDSAPLPLISSNANPTTVTPTTQTESGQLQTTQDDEADPENEPRRRSKRDSLSRIYLDIDYYALFFGT
mmetsp:Transcript_753/g.1003  ORF Transcript_753/g.1003 Transcript_753/m.1003 type:complete len:292 (-) Transcript_753:227-1102(-)